MPDALTVGSLFTGIGGFDLGFERAGMRVLWQCEQDPFCRAVLAQHWPDVPCHPDVRALMAVDAGEGEGVSVPVPRVDVICGGFPCQDISYAGLGAGITGERSGLWTEMLRVVRLLRPRWVVVENVPALRSRGLDVVLGGLAACGFDAEWDCLPASAFGAPHQRDRIWLVAYPQSSEGGRGAVQGQGGNGRLGVHGAARPVADAEVIGERAGLRAGQPTPLGGARPGHGGGDVADADERPDLGGVARPVQRPVSDGARGRWDQHPWAVEPDVGRVADGVPARVDRLRALGNALLPQIAEELGRRIVEWEAA